MDDKINSYRQVLFKLDHQGHNNPEAATSRISTANAFVISKSELTDVTRFSPECIGWSKHLQTRSCCPCSSRLVSA